MKQIGILLAVVAAVSVGCNRTERDAVGTSGSAPYSTTTTAPPAAKPDISSADKDFVNDLTFAGKAEVELGKLAATHASSPAVKQFGAHMVEEHAAAGEKLHAVAAAHAIPEPTGLDSKHQELYDKLAKYKGAEFDREYMKAMVDGHQDVLSEVESRVDKTSLTDWKSKMIDALPGAQTPTAQPPSVVPERSDDPVRMAINQWAADAYPEVYRHLQSAKKIDDQLEHRKRTQ